ncbi:MAG: acyl-CoA reductase [Gemmatimonadota bacterium]
MTSDELLTEARRLRSSATELRQHSWREVAQAIDHVARRFLDPTDSLRVEALGRLPEDALVSPEMAEVILDGMARDWVAERIDRAIELDFGDPAVLDGFGTAGSRRLTAVGPELTVHIVAGGVPGVGTHAMVRSLLVKSPTLLKAGRGDGVIPELFCRALSDDVPWLAEACLARQWDRDRVDLTTAALRHAEVATVYGSDQTISAIRRTAPPTTRLVEYRHRESIVVVGSEALRPERVRAAAASVANAIGAFEQRGCVCPHLVYVEDVGSGGPLGFAEHVADAMRRLQVELPSAPLDVDEASALQQLRGVAELHAATSTDRVWYGEAGGSWTIVFEAEPREGPPTLRRSARVRPWADLGELVDRLRPTAAHLQSLGVVGLGDRTEDFSLELGRLGATRVTNPADMAFPPPWWLHYGRRSMEELVRWVELEAG